MGQESSEDAEGWGTDGWSVLRDQRESGSGSPAAEKFFDGISGVGDPIADGVADVGDGVTNGLSALGNGVADGLDTITDGIANGLDTIANGVDCVLTDDCGITDIEAAIVVGVECVNDGLSAFAGEADSGVADGADIDGDGDISACADAECSTDSAADGEFSIIESDSTLGAGFCASACVGGACDGERADVDGGVCFGFDNGRSADFAFDDGGGWVSCDLDAATCGGFGLGGDASVCVDASGHIDAADGDGGRGVSAVNVGGDFGSDRDAALGIEAIEIETGLAFGGGVHFGTSACAACDGSISACGLSCGFSIHASAGFGVALGMDAVGSDGDGALGVGLCASAHKGAAVVDQGGLGLGTDGAFGEGGTHTEVFGCVVSGILEGLEIFSALCVGFALCGVFGGSALCGVVVVGHAGVDRGGTIVLVIDAATVGRAVVGGLVGIVALGLLVDGGCAVVSGDIGAEILLGDLAIAAKLGVKLGRSFEVSALDLCGCRVGLGTTVDVLRVALGGDLGAGELGLSEIGAGVSRFKGVAAAACGGSRRGGAAAVGLLGLLGLLGALNIVVVIIRTTDAHGISLHLGGKMCCRGCAWVVLVACYETTTKQLWQIFIMEYRLVLRRVS